MPRTSTSYSNTSTSLPLTESEVYHLRMLGRLPLPKHPRIIDLFSGAGGLTLGFTKAFGHGFKPVWANDFNKFAVNSYNENFGNHCMFGDIVELLDNPEIKIPRADIVIGGPPCQGFSLLNKNRDGDPRKHLWQHYLEVVRQSGAEIFVMENVPQLLNTPEHREIVTRAEQMGFKVAWTKLVAADYGVPQTRQRAFILGCKFEDPWKHLPPLKTHFGKGNGSPPDLGEGYIQNPEPWKTVQDAIADLPKPKGVEIRNEQCPLDLHFGRNPTELSKKRYRAIPKEGMNRFDLQRNAPELTPQCWIRKKSGGTDLFGRLWWNRPAFTIRTEFFKPEKGRYLHPVQHRPITHREAARFQSFPDDFRFRGSKVEIAKQIGNAVPPMLAARIADVVYTLQSRKMQG